MKCYQKLEELFKIYSKAALLSDKNDCRVLKVRHKMLENELIIHTMPRPNPIYEFLTEIKHKNLPLVYDVFSLDDGIVVLEEYIDGMNLFDICASGKMTRRGAFKILRKLCDALTVLHQNKIVHRDVKPENVMVTPEGRVVLIDFNAARRVTLESTDTTALGTIGYASPEQIVIAHSDTRTDIYAMGILLNVLLTDKHPSEKTPKGRAGRIVKKCTAISPDDRYQSAKELKKALSLI